MIGDNPAADIRGANDAGEPWRSVLVRSGSIVGGDPQALPPRDRPSAVAAHLEEAVERILAGELR
jgi:ribonucleotide monophosphatase NagD (HAD superfamily)